MPAVAVAAVAVVVAETLKTVAAVAAAAAGSMTDLGSRAHVAGEDYDSDYKQGYTASSLPATAGDSQRRPQVLAVVLERADVGLADNWYMMGVHSDAFAAAAGTGLGMPPFSVD